MNYKIIVSGYNCYDYLKRCFDSIKNQKYDNFKVIVTDDCSPDKRQAEYIAKFATDNGWDYIINGERTGNLYNHIRGIRTICTHPEDVIVFVDADDRLAHDNVLNVLDKYYSAGVDMTYGSYETDPEDNRCPAVMPYPDNNFRITPIRFNHLRTLKYKLIQAMDDSDFKDLDGNWFTNCGDTAIMVPALELCGGNYAFIDEILYVYSTDNNLSEWRVNSGGITKNHDRIFRDLPVKKSIYDK